CHDVVLFFFQAEDGIRDFHVTGVQTCALPIWTVKPDQRENLAPGILALGDGEFAVEVHGAGRATGGIAPGPALRRIVETAGADQIGRASCRERVESWVAAESVREKGRERTTEV